MENRDRDNMSRNQQSSDAGKVNRDTSNKQSDSSYDFGEKIGRSENLGNESSRRSGSEGMSGSSSSRSGSSSRRRSGNSGFGTEH